MNFPINKQLTAYDEIKNMIVTLALKPGTKINENDLMQQLDLGRTPIREAIIRLKSEGLIDVKPQSGTYVSLIDLKLAEDARYLRELVEVDVVKKAANKQDPDLVTQLNLNIAQAKILSQTHDSQTFFKFDNDFHKIFYQAADELNIWEWMQTINTQLERFRYLRLSIQTLDWKTITAQHQEIIDSLKVDDIPAVQEKTKQHLHLMLQEEKILVTTFPEYFAKP